MDIPKIIKIVGFQTGHDLSYCILENGIPIIHEEGERFSRIKAERGDGLKFFLTRCKDRDYKYFTFGNWGGRSGEFRKYHRMDEASEILMKKMIRKNKGAYYEFSHHICHAANAFYTSNFDRALVITIDGGGAESNGLDTALTICEGNDNKIEKITTFLATDINIGILWNRCTKYIFGLSGGPPKGDQAGTVMAMASLGEPKYKDVFINFYHRYHRNLRNLKVLADSSEQEKFNIAASLQKYTEEKFYSLVAPYIQKSNFENICFSGGVSLNCVLLGKIREWFPNIKGLFCDPIPYDGGLSLGSARYLWHHVWGNPRIKDNIQNMSPYLGITYSKEEVLKACDLFSDKIKQSNADDTVMLEKIYDQKVISVFGGGAESGRRALGNRSILADPRNKEMRAIINEKVKHRQWFRPLAPAILEEKISEWFVDPLLSPYMSFALKYKNEKRVKVPAVVHYDGTGRLQTVNKNLSPWFHNFLKRWELKSGIPILINTSFNDTEPIVETPEDALSCFLSTNIDYLYFFDYGILVEKT